MSLILRREDVSSNSSQLPLLSGHHSAGSSLEPFFARHCIGGPSNASDLRVHHAAFDDRCAGDLRGQRVTWTLLRYFLLWIIYNHLWSIIYNHLDNHLCIFWFVAPNGGWMSFWPHKMMLRNGVSFFSNWDNGVNHLNLTRNHPKLVLFGIPFGMMVYCSFLSMFFPHCTLAIKHGKLENHHLVRWCSH